MAITPPGGVGGGSPPRRRQTLRGVGSAYDRLHALLTRPMPRTPDPNQRSFVLESAREISTHPPLVALAEQFLSIPTREGGYTVPEMDEPAQALLERGGMTAAHFLLDTALYYGSYSYGPTSRRALVSVTGEPRAVILEGLTSSRIEVSRLCMHLVEGMCKAGDYPEGVSALRAVTARKDLRGEYGENAWLALARLGDTGLIDQALKWLGHPQREYLHDTLVTVVASAARADRGIRERVVMALKNFIRNVNFADEASWWEDVKAPIVALAFLDPASIPALFHELINRAPSAIRILVQGVWKFVRSDAPMIDVGSTLAECPKVVLGGQGGLAEQKERILDELRPSLEREMEQWARAVEYDEKFSRAVWDLWDGRFGRRFKALRNFRDFVQNLYGSVYGDPRRELEDHLAALKQPGNEDELAATDLLLAAELGSDFDAERCGAWEHLKRISSDYPLPRFAARIREIDLPLSRKRATEEFAGLTRITYGELLDHAKQRTRDALQNVRCVRDLPMDELRAFDRVRLEDRAGEVRMDRTVFELARRGFFPDAPHVQLSHKQGIELASIAFAALAESIFSQWSTRRNVPEIESVARLVATLEGVGNTYRDELSHEMVGHFRHLASQLRVRAFAGLTYAQQPVFGKLVLELRTIFLSTRVEFPA